MHIVHTEADGGKGGQPLRIINESLGMIQRGHQVTLLCPETAPLHALARNAGLPVVTMPLKRKNLKNLQVLRRWMKDNRHSIDVINSHNSADTWLVAETSESAVLLTSAIVVASLFVVSLITGATVRRLHDGR